MKKILIVMTTLGSGGAEKSLVNFLNELPPHKYDIDLLLFKKQGMFLKQVPNWVNVVETPVDIKKLYGLSGNKHNLTKLYATFMSQLHENDRGSRKAYRWEKYFSQKIDKLDKKYDVAIAYLSGEILYFVDEKVNAVKKLVWVHNDYNAAGHPKKYDIKHLHNMDIIVSISDECVDILKKEFPDLSDRIVCIPNIVSSKVVKTRAEEFYPKEYDKGKVNILSIGRLNSQKGFDMAISASKLIKDSGLDFRWYIIGNGDLEKKLKKQAADLGVSENVIFLGTRENPYPYIKNCTIFIQPSRYEGKSVVLDEAKILAKPIIATAYPTVMDQITDNIDGKIVTMNSEGIADGIINLLKKTDLMNDMVRYLKSHEYGNQFEIKKYMSVIENND